MTACACRDTAAATAAAVAHIHERYKEGTHIEILKALLADYFEMRGDDTYVNIIGHRDVGAMSMNSQTLF